MIFRQCAQVLNGSKTQTRRPVKPEHQGLDHLTPWMNGKWWVVGRTYAVQPGRGEKAVGRIRITKIRRERLNEISREDAMAETGGIDYAMPVSEFCGIWNPLYRKSYRWEDNPEVWVLEFERV